MSINNSNENPTTKTQRKEKNTMSINDKNAKKNSKKNERNLERKREQVAANDAVSVSADEFRAFGEAVATSATSATEAMLNQAQLVFNVSEDYGQNRFDTVLLNFRNKTDLGDASKYSQFKQIGRFASVLRPVASQLPSGWTSLYALASALKKEDKNGNPITIDTLLMVQDDDGAPKLNGYSTQSEVRRIVHQAQGKQPAKKKDAPPPTLTVAFGINAQLLSSQENFAEVEQFLRDALRKKFPFIEDVAVKTNKVLRSTLESKPLGSEMKKAA